MWWTIIPRRGPGANVVHSSISKSPSELPTARIGRRPIAAFGNSDGDFEMLEWTTAAKGRRLGVIVHHTDAVREWAYDRDYGFAPLARGLLEAPERGWTVVDMKRDWKLVFGFQR